MKDLNKALEGDDIDILAAVAGLKDGMNAIGTELGDWINSKALYDRPFIAAALRLSSDGLIATMDPTERTVTEEMLKIFRVISFSMQVPKEEGDGDGD